MMPFALSRVTRLPHWARSLLILCMLFTTPAQGTGLSIGITPVFLDDQLSLLQAWGSYLSRRLGEPVQFIQRGSYREIVHLTVEGKLDFAWICGYPYVSSQQRLVLTAVPLYQGKPQYHAYLIVPAEDHTTRHIGDLEKRIFAYSDPDSNSGFLVPRYDLWSRGIDPDNFFRKSFFTGAHRKVVEAVGVGLADGGAVDGYVWDTLAQLEPELTARTRIVEVSSAFGFPPLVSGRGVPKATVKRLRDVLMNMHEDAQGKSLLRRMNLDGFAPGDDSLFRGIAAMANKVERRQ